MKNRTIAIKVKKIVPWWECDGDIYKQTMELLERGKNMKRNIVYYYRDRRGGRLNGNL